MGQLRKILLKDIMFSDPITLKVGEPFSRVAKLFHMHHIRHLPIVDGNNKLQGLVTERDLLRFMSPRAAENGEFVDDGSRLDEYSLEQVMKRNLFSLAENDTLDKAVDLMIKYKLGCIPIVDREKNLKGIVTQIDVLRVLPEHFD